MDPSKAVQSNYVINYRQSMKTEEVREGEVRLSRLAYEGFLTAGSDELSLPILVMYSLRLLRASNWFPFGCSTTFLCRRYRGNQVRQCIYALRRERYPVFSHWLSATRLMKRLQVFS